jgi:hypothetical protein
VAGGKVPKKALNARTRNKPDTHVLEGIIIVDDYYAALVKDIANQRAGTQKVMVGDTIGSYQVESITDEKMIMRGKDGDRKVLNLINSEGRVSRGNKKTIITAPLTSRPGPVTRPPLPHRRVVPSMQGK